jgi:glycosyltransferase involved in cell wall biosynthesis
VVQRLSILVPVYNEARTVETLLRRVAAVTFPIDREIIVVDDGSTDGSREILEPLARCGLIRLFKHPINRGKGAAIRTALAFAKGDVVVVQDADLELEPDDLPSLLTPILCGEAPVCYGSRFAAHEGNAAFRLRPTYWANRMLNRFSNALNGIALSDFNTCYKMMRRDVLSRFAITQTGFAMEPEITGKLARLGVTIVERPIRYRPRSMQDGKKIRFTDLFRYLVAMIRYRYFWTGDTQAGFAPAMSATASAPAGAVEARFFVATSPNLPALPDAVA